MIDATAGDAVYYYHFDGLGSVVALSNKNSEIVERYSYDVFGEPNTISGLGNPYLFTARRYDDETGLYYYRARYYSPALGRFLQTDPVGYIAGLNLYSYVGNNPIYWSDPYGLFNRGQFWTGVGQLAMSTAGFIGVQAAFAINPFFGYGVWCASVYGGMTGIANIMSSFKDDGFPTLPGSLPGAVGMAFCGEEGAAVGDLVTDVATWNLPAVGVDVFGMVVNEGVGQLEQYDY